MLKQSQEHGIERLSEVNKVKILGGVRNSLGNKEKPEDTCLISFFQEIQDITSLCYEECYVFKSNVWVTNLGFFACLLFENELIVYNMLFCFF